MSNFKRLAFHAAVGTALVANVALVIAVDGVLQKRRAAPDALASRAKLAAMELCIADRAPAFRGHAYTLDGARPDTVRIAIDGTKREVRTYFDPITETVVMFTQGGAGTGQRLQAPVATPLAVMPPPLREHLVVAKACIDAATRQKPMP